VAQLCPKALGLNVWILKNVPKESGRKNVDWTQRTQDKIESLSRVNTAMNVSVP
jgi:hypothetical protein